MSEPSANASAVPLLLGVEGGGTKTVAWIASPRPDGEFEILGQGASGPSNLHAIGLDLTFASLSEALSEAWKNANTKRVPVAAACLTMAGVDRPQEEALLTQWARSQHLAQHIQVTNDSVGLLAAGTTAGWGIGLVAGTGSIAFGQTPDGRTTRTGGWGYLMGDEGSAYAVTLAGLRAAVRAADGRQDRTRLLPDFLDRLGLIRPDDLLETIYLSKRDRAWIASLADVVTSAANAGDPAAVEILDAAARELALLVATTARKLNLDQTLTPVCFTGGLLLGTPALQQRLIEELANENIPVADCIPVTDPVLGAIKLASQLPDPNP